MNKIFKIVWSKSRQCYIVVSEYAKNTSGKKAVATALLAFAVLAGSSAVQAAWPDGAQVGQSNFQIGRGARAGIGSGSQNSQAIGVDAEAHQSKDVALGSNAVAKGLPISSNKAHPATALGAHSNANGDSTLAVGFGTNASSTNATAVGANASATGTDSTVVGSGASANQASASVLGSNATVTGVAGTAVGSSSTAANNSFAGGNNATATGGNSVAIGMTTKASGTGSVAVGNTAQATNTSTTAVGDGAKATGISSSAFGQKANATNSYALAVGVGAQATNIFTSALGYNATAVNNYGTALGANANAGRGSGTAVGSNAMAVGAGATAVGGSGQIGSSAYTAAGNNVSGTGAANATGDNSLAVGYRSQALNTEAVAVGTTAIANGTWSVAVGRDLFAKGINSVAMGESSQAMTDNAVAVGLRNNSTGGSAVTLGRDLTANGAQSVAIGSSSSASGQFALAIGSGYNSGNPATPSSYGANASGNSSIAIGRSTQATAMGATAIGGAQDDSALGAKASGVYATAIGGLSEASGAGALALGSNNNGFGARATGEKAIAVGAAATASGAQSIVVGVNSSATGTAGIAMGRNVINQGNDAQAIGNSSSVRSHYGTALGTFATVAGNADRGIAIGNSNQASTATTVKVADGIALGSYSVADKGAGVSGYNMTALRDNSYAGTTGAFTSGLGALAIGTGQKTRQITGVAAGNADTDAVNVAQLRSVSSRVKAYNENTANGASDYILANQALVAKSTDKDKLEIQALNTNEGVTLTFTPKTTAVIQNGKSLVTAGDVYTAIDNAKTHYVSVKSTENNNRNNNGANGLNSVAIGGDVGVSGDESIGIGHSITGNGDGPQSVLLGSQIMNLNRESVLIGQNLFNKGTNNILIGKGIAANDAYASNNVVLGNGATLSGAQAVLIGKGTGSYGASTVTIGDGTTAGTQAHPSAGAVTIGKGAKSYGASAVTIGDGASVGTTAQAVTNSVAIGKGATATGESSVVIGDHARSSNVGSVAIGYSNSVSADNGVAIGNGTSVTAIDGVAIGNSSMANRAPGVTGYDANDNKTDKYAGLTGRAIMSNHGAVSIGGNGFSRQIIGVSAGSADTDAVNVAQLKSVNLGFAGNTGTSDVNLAQSTLGIKGDNTYIKTAAAGRNLTITPNIQNITMNGTTASAGTGLADANNVASAINTAVNSAGWKIKAMGSGQGVRTGDTTETRIGNNDSVLLQAGDNLVINKTGSRFTYSLNPILNNLTKAMFTSGSDVTTIDANSITMTSSGISLTNSGINAGNKVISNVASGGTTATNAANIGDVQNAVANLSQNLTVTDGTNSGTVNLKNQSLKVAGANGITTNMNGQTLTVGLDSTTNNKVNDTATAVGRTISLGGDTGTTTAKSLTTGDVNFGIKSGNGYLTTAANGNDVTLTVNEGAVKDAAVSAVTVSTDAATDNPVTITPTTGTNSKDYKITVDTSKLAQKTNLAYTADNGTGGTTSLSQGLTFKDGTLTTATAGANGTITYDVKKGTLANTGGTVSVTGNDGVATAQNVADMINNATTSVSTLNIADGGTGTGSVNLKNQTLKVTGSNGLTTTASGQVIDVALDATTKNKIDNAADKDLSNLSTTGTQKIKDAAAFKVKANGDAGDDVKGGDEVNFKDGQNIKVSRTGKEFTIATADDVSFNKVTAADSVLVGTGTNLITLDGTTGTVTGNIFKAGSVNVNGANNTVTGLSNTTWSGTPVSGRAATEDQLKTIADRVANAGWKATSGITGSGTQSGTQSVTSVGSGDTVIFNAGDNLDMNQNGATFTYSLKPTLTGLTSAAFTDGTNTTTVNGSGVTAGGVSLTNSGINAGNKVISNVASGGTTVTNAANIGDVQNAVANLSQNLTVTDGTNSGTVNLKNQSLKVAGANGITTNMNGQTLTVGLDSTTNNKVNDTATAVGRTISLGGDTGTTTAKSLTTGDVNFGIKSGNGYLTTAANGNDVTLTVNEGAVKDAAVSAVTVSTDAATDNPVTITPTTGTNSKDYKITVDTSKLAQKTNLAYTADNGTGGTTSLSQGLTFKDGTLTTATAGANGTITYDVKKGTLANTGGTVSVTGNDGVATAQNVADMINNATTSVSTLNIADGGTGTGSVNLKNQTLKVTGSNGLTTTASGQVIDVALDATTKNKIDNAADKDLSNLSTTGTQKIKDAAAFKVKANGDAGDDVKGGDEVNFKDGQNIKVSRTGKEFTIATADDVSFNKVTAADSVLVGTGTNLITLDGTTGTVTGNIFKAGSVNVNGANNTVTGLSNTTWSGTPVSGRAATEDQLKTIADRVANAGWKATSGITGSGTQSGTQSVTSVGSGDTVIFNAGDNLDMNQNGATFTYSLKPTLTGLTSAAFTDGTNTTTVNGSGVTAGGVSLTNSGINAGNKVISNVASGGTTVTNAANIGDVQNAVANLSQNLTVTDGTNSGTVNLKNQSLKVAGANGITTNMNGQTLTVGLDSTTNNKVNDTATAVGRTISLGGDTGTTTAKSLTTGDVNFGIKSGNGYLTTAANGNDVTLTVNEGAVKDAAVSAVTVSTDAATDNPVTITPTTGTNSKDYKITVDTSKLAQKTNLAYTADNGTGGTTSLSQGLTFKDGTLTTATAGANGTITYDVKKGTLANTGGTVSVTGNDGVATAQNVADMINNATTSVSTLNIADGGTGTGSVNLKNQTLKVTGSNGLTTTASGQVIDVALDATTKNKIDNAADKDLSNLSTTGTQKIKDAAAFKVKANGDAGDDVKGGDEVNFKDGQNIKVSRTGKEFTIATADDVSFNKVTAADSVLVGTGTNLITLDGTTGTVTGNIFKAGNVSVSNSGINAGNKVISNVASGGTTVTNAANIGDVQNAVANLSQNLTVTDGTNSGTVNLKNQSLKVAGANGITTNMNGQTLTVGLDSTTNNKVNDTATAVGRTISLGGDTGTTTAKSLTTGDVNFGIKSGNGYLTTAANGNDVTLTVNEGAVKDAAVSAVTVSTDAATDNPVTITPTTGTNSKDYKITVDTSKLAQKTNLAYTADNGTGGTTSLSQGLTFKDGTLTTATAGANGTITYDVKKGTLANTGGTVSVTGNDGVATAQNVADMINNATTSVSTLNIADGGTGTGSVNLKNQTLKVTGSNGLTTTASGQVIDVALDATTKNKIDNAADKDLSNLSTTGTQKIKDAAAFKVKANGDAGDDVKGGDEVNFKDGQNIKVSRTGKEFTIATADDVSFNKVTAADSVLVGTGTNLITLDGTTGTVTGNIFKAGSVNVNGANNTVTGLSNTTWSGTPVSGRAATEDQLKQVADDARAAAGSSKTVVTANSGEGANSTTGNISLTSTTAANGQVTYDVKLADKVTVGTAGNAVTVDGTTGKVTAKDGDFSNKVTVGTGSNKVTVDGADGSVTANTVKAGNVTVNGSNNTITGLSNTTWSGTTTTPDRAATEGQLKQVADAAKSAVDNVTMKYDGDNGGTQTLALKNGTFNVNGDGQFTETTANATGIQVKVKEAAVKDAAVSAVTVSTDTSNPNNPITVTATPGSHSMDYKVTFDGTKAAQSTNLSYKANGGSAETVSLSTGLNFKDGNLTTASVAPNGDVKYDVKTATIAVNNGMAGLSGNDGVATAQNVVDAMNAISHQTTGGLERVVNRIGAVESEGRRVAAQSAALAALKPIQYDPLEPNQIMAGIGNYRGETAAAVGLAHYANEDTMLHMGVALGDNNNMVNVGVTHKFGSAAKKAAIPDRYKAGPISSVYVMQDEVTQLRAENAQQKATLTKQQEEIDALKAAVAQLMAKQ